VRMRHRVASELLRNGQVREAEEMEFQTLQCDSVGPRVFDLLLSNYGRVDAEVHYSLYGLAEIWKAQGKLGFAERLLKCLLEMLAESSSKRVETAIELADVFRLQKWFDEAEHMLKQAAATIENTRNFYALSLKLQESTALILRDKGDMTAAETQFSQLLASQKPFWVPTIHQS